MPSRTYEHLVLNEFSICSILWVLFQHRCKYHYMCVCTIYTCIILCICPVCMLAQDEIGKQMKSLYDTLTSKALQVYGIPSKGLPVRCLRAPEIFRRCFWYFPSRIYSIGWSWRLKEGIHRKGQKPAVDPSRPGAEQRGGSSDAQLFLVIELFFQIVLNVPTICNSKTKGLAIFVFMFAFKRFSFHFRFRIEPVSRINESKPRFEAMNRIDESTPWIESMNHQPNTETNTNTNDAHANTETNKNHFSNTFNKWPQIEAQTLPLLGFLLG